MDARTGYTDDMTQREPEGGALVRAAAGVVPFGYRFTPDRKDLGLSVVAHQDGKLEASWRFEAAVLRNGSDKKSKNKHATEHQLVRSFQSDEVVMEPSRLEKSR